MIEWCCLPRHHRTWKDVRARLTHQMKGDSGMLAAKRHPLLPFHTRLEDEERPSAIAWVLMSCGRLSSKSMCKAIGLSSGHAPYLRANAVQLVPSASHALCKKTGVISSKAGRAFQLAPVGRPGPRLSLCGASGQGNSSWEASRSAHIDECTSALCIIPVLLAFPWRTSIMTSMGT
jgi:hypothetical protein